MDEKRLAARLNVNDLARAICGTQLAIYSKKL